VATAGISFHEKSLFLSPKSHSEWPDQVADDVVSNQGFGFLRKREREVSVFKGLQKPLSAQIQRQWRWPLAAAKAA
jgi:hypothetical protein